MPPAVELRIFRAFVEYAACLTLMMIFGITSTTTWQQANMFVQFVSLWIQTHAKIYLVLYAFGYGWYGFRRRSLASLSEGPQPGSLAAYMNRHAVTGGTLRARILIIIWCAFYVLSINPDVKKFFENISV